jgi:uncharacterized glyoxalase superfamily protein PhnB
VPPAEVTGIAPQFLVDDLERAIVYYRDQLGFELDFTYESFYASVSRDGFAIHLKHGHVPAEERKRRREDEHLDAYVSVEGVGVLFEELEARGAQVVQPLTQQAWSCLEFIVQDADGYILCFSELQDEDGE